MKKIFIALAAVAAMVGCSKENAPIDAIEKDSFTMNASIVLDDTRVSVEGDKFTDVKWEAGDKVTLSSAAGASATLAAEAGGDTNIRFVGEGTAAADTDTYYAIYPATTITNGVANVELVAQSGDDAAVLVAKSAGNKGEAIDMAFKPVNSLLHVAVSGVQSLSKAEFKSYTGKLLAANFTYNYADDTIEHGTATESSYGVETPSADGFFFSLPADLEMSEGYVVTLTDTNGNVCSKAYEGKTFARGTTTRVNIEWSIPSVTLGVPMTSYSYYNAGDSATANSCANNVIYFTQSSTYSNLQNAMVAEAGFIVDDTTYTATLDTATKSFSMGNVTVSSWGAKSVEAFVKTKDGRTIKSAPATVYITGLPYYTDWRAGNNTDWKYIDGSYQSSAFRINCVSSRWGGYIVGGAITPEFKIPDTSIRVYGAIAASTRATDASQSDRCYIYSGNRNSATVMEGDYVNIYYSATDSMFPDTELVKMSNPSTLTASNPCLVFAGETYRILGIGTNLYTYFYQAQITYAEK